jgi:hypothetical protein
MTGSRVTRLLSLLVCGAAVAAVAGVVPAAVGATPEVTACVERNLPRYSNPGSSVVAQYSDLETLCQDMIDDGASLEFDPDGGGSPGTDGDAAAPPSSGSPVPEPSPGTGVSGATSPAAEAPAPAAPRTRAPSRAPAPAAPAPEPAKDPSSALLVTASIQESGSAPGSPLPSSLSDGSLWLYVLLGGAVVAMAGAATVAVRRRR